MKELFKLTLESEYTPNIAQVWTERLYKRTIYQQSSLFVKNRHKTISSINRDCQQSHRDRVWYLGSVSYGNGSWDFKWKLK